MPCYIQGWMFSSLPCPSFILHPSPPQWPKVYLGVNIRMLLTLSEWWPGSWCWLRLVKILFVCVCISNNPTSDWRESEAYLRGALGHGPPFGQTNFFFDIEKKLENLVGPLLCMSTRGQRKFGPPFRNPKYATEENANVKALLSFHAPQSRCRHLS